MNKAVSIRYTEEQFRLVYKTTKKHSVTHIHTRTHARTRAHTHTRMHTQARYIVYSLHNTRKPKKLHLKEQHVNPKHVPMAIDVYTMQRHINVVTTSCDVVKTSNGKSQIQPTLPSLKKCILT